MLEDFERKQISRLFYVVNTKLDAIADCLECNKEPATPTKIKFDIKKTMGWCHKNYRSTECNILNEVNLIFEGCDLNMCLRFENITYTATLYQERPGYHDARQWIELSDIECQGDDLNDAAINCILYDAKENKLTSLYDLMIKEAETKI